MELWCVHIHGPDDVHAAPDKEAAEQRAAELNACFAKEDAKHVGDPNWPTVEAVVVPWDGSEESHADDLKNWNGKW